MEHGWVLPSAIQSLPRLRHIPQLRRALREDSARIPSGGEKLVPLHRVELVAGQRITNPQPAQEQSR